MTAHQVAAADGRGESGELLGAHPQGSECVNTLRVLQNGEFIVTRTEYNVVGPAVRFDMVRFERGPSTQRWATIEAIPQRPSR
jgi:hypothetical protein